MKKPKSSLVPSSARHIADVEWVSEGT
jgi:hypothetical protein